MQIRFILIFIAFSLLVSCYQPQRDCKAFKDGKFTFASIIDNKEVSTVFERNGDLEIDYFDGKIDSSSVRWINDCEYIMKKMRKGATPCRYTQSEEQSRGKVGSCENIDNYGEFIYL